MIDLFIVLHTPDEISPPPKVLNHIWITSLEHHNVIIRLSVEACAGSVGYSAAREGTRALLQFFNSPLSAKGGGHIFMLGAKKDAYEREGIFSEHPRIGGPVSTFPFST